jgi:hypothetical protein
MKERKTIPVGVLFMILILALASLGVGYGLWRADLSVTGFVHTGDVDAVFSRTFTDDDNVVNMSAYDSLDTGDCPVSVAGETSCDPAASGHDPKPHYDKDVSECFSAVTTDAHKGEVRITNGYPSYYCTAFFFITNTGSVPVKIVSTTINGVPVLPSETTEFNLAGDSDNDLSIHLTDIEICQQIDPEDTVLMDIDQHVLQGAPQGVDMEYTVEVQLNQWNESEPCTFDKIIDADGTATRFSGDPGAREVTVGDLLTVWPTGFWQEGLDWFDTDSDGDWTFGPAGDDLHVEDPTLYPLAVRDGDHDDTDPLVLDIDNSLATPGQEPVDCDMESGSFCAIGMLPGRMRFFDTNGNGYWDNGEDIVYDANNNGVFD